MHTIDKTLIGQLVKHVLVEVPTVKTPGIYFGMAGISIALFEAAKVLEDKEVEERAFNLIQHALVSHSFDKSYESGLSGIGMALIYLIQRNFLEADFNELFSDKLQLILNAYEKVDLQPNTLLSTTRVVQFLSAVKPLSDKSEIQSVINKFLQGIELFLSIQFFDWRDPHYVGKKQSVIGLFNTYLKLVKTAKYKHYSRTLLQAFLQLFKEGRIAKSLHLGSSLAAIAEMDESDEYQDIIDENIRYGLKNMYFSHAFLDEQISILNAVSLLPKEYTSLRIRILSKKLIPNLRPNTPPSSLLSGLSRWILYLCNPQNNLL
ncbi:hypothetical protein [uncultured Alloprevotella sp.]|uniref:hypothetical protein n=1 Tax=uncultured Alloprevotella sp. TaxID=1283315 RepID=UPI00325FB18E